MNILTSFVRRGWSALNEVRGRDGKGSDTDVKKLNPGKTLHSSTEDKNSKFIGQYDVDKLPEYTRDVRPGKFSLAPQGKKLNDLANLNYHALEAYIEFYQQFPTFH